MTATPSTPANKTTVIDAGRLNVDLEKKLAFAIFRLSEYLDKSGAEHALEGERTVYWKASLKAIKENKNFSNPAAVKANIGLAMNIAREDLGGLVNAYTHDGLAARRLNLSHI